MKKDNQCDTNAFGISQLTIINPAIIRSEKELLKLNPDDIKEGVGIIYCDNSVNSKTLVNITGKNTGMTDWVEVADIAPISNMCDRCFNQYYSPSSSECPYCTIEKMKTDYQHMMFELNNISRTLSSTIDTNIITTNIILDNRQLSELLRSVVSIKDYFGPLNTTRSYFCQRVLALAGNRPLAICYLKQKQIWDDSVVDACSAILQYPGNIGQAIMLAREFGWWNIDSPFRLDRFLPSRCPECKVLPGEYHQLGCDIEHCSSCGGQRLTCECEAVDRNQWLGYYDGTKECIEYDFISDNDNIIFDYNRLYSECHWSKEEQRYVKNK